MELNTKTAEASSIVTARNQLLRFAELAYFNYGDIGFTVRVPYKQILFERQFTAIGNTRTGKPFMWIIMNTTVLYLFVSKLYSK